MSIQDSVVVDDSKSTQEAKPEIKEATIGEKVEIEKSKPAPDSVPLAKYMEEKNTRKELENRIKELEAKGTPSNKDLSALAEKYGASPELLVELESRFDSKLSSATEERLKGLLPELESIKAERNAEKFEKTFKDMWDVALANSPEFTDVADIEIIKSLVKQPENHSLTLTQLIDKTYGKFIQGKKTIETTQGGKSVETTDIDFNDMSDENWEMVKSNPDLKEKYNAHILKNLRF